MKFCTKMILIGAVLTLSACAHPGFREKKAPCSPMAATSNKPCALVPINYAGNLLMQNLG